MIYYFSGTGNSRWVAEQLAVRLSDRLVEIGNATLLGNYKHQLSPGERIGWVFPTYSWGPAPVVLDFVNKWHIDGYEKGNTYCYMVTTCGDDIGLSVDIFAKALGHIDLSAAFSIQMPNNYILLPGFDTDPTDLEQQKKTQAIERIKHVSDVIEKRSKLTDVVTGNYKWLKSRVIRRFFMRYLMSDKHFMTDTALCNSCGTCVAVCPMHNISIDDNGHPLWHGKCAMCLSCIHRCPLRAIQYGKISRKKGRYYFK